MADFFLVKSKVATTCRRAPVGGGHRQGAEVSADGPAEHQAEPGRARTPPYSTGGVFGNRWLK